MTSELVTAGVKITVKAHFENEFSVPLDGRYIFLYFITIENQNDFSIKLMDREWNIFDSNWEHRTVQGEGVIGKQPIIKSGEVYSYSSASDLTTDRGRMKGSYRMLNIQQNSFFKVTIPEFLLEAPFAKN
jgi:ApaG protein